MPHCVKYLGIKGACLFSDNGKASEEFDLTQVMFMERFTVLEGCVNQCRMLLFFRILAVVILC